MHYTIDKVEKSEYEEVVAVWEASVRATHDFLTEADIAHFRPLILEQYLDLVELRCMRNEAGNAIIGFLGVADQKIEMLFVHPNQFGKGIGRKLIHYAINEFGAEKVDVNEDNPEAVGFYEHVGFVVVSRSELDPLGNPFPILHMELSNK